MAAVLTVVLVVGVLCLGYWIFSRDDDHDEWKGW